MSNNRHKIDGHRDLVHHHNNHNHHPNHDPRMKTYVQQEDEREHSPIARFFFGILWCFAQVGLWGSMILFLYWILKFDKGFAWVNDKRRQFNLHSFLMIVGFIFLNGQSMLIYKTFLCCKKIYNKIIHTIIFVMSISTITFGMIVAIEGQHIAPPDQPAQHFYSIHSWMGLVTCALFALQFLVGFVSFLVLLCCERATASFRAKLLPTHVTFGLIIFSLAVGTCISGLLQTARHRLNGPNEKNPDTPSYKNLTHPVNPFLNPAVVINIVGACLIGLGVIMPYIVRNFSHQKRHRSFSIN